MQAQYGSTRPVVTAVFAASALLALGCTDASRGPLEVRAVAIDADASEMRVRLRNMRRLQCEAQSYDSVSRVIGSSGGTMVVGPHTFVVPPGALGRRVRITAVAPSIKRRMVRFQPEGLTFATPATLTLSYAGCHHEGQALPKQIVHVDDDDKDPNELVSSLDSLSARTVTGKIGHFSGYAVWY